MRIIFCSVSFCVNQSAVRFEDLKPDFVLLIEKYVETSKNKVKMASYLQIQKYLDKIDKINTN